MHVNKLVSGAGKLSNYQILALPGGFSYGDDIAAGKIHANELRTKLNQPISEFVSAGKLVIGICNGFQILVKSGFLPGNPGLEQEASLIINDCGSFRDEWVSLRPQGKCVWTKDLPAEIYLPIAHGEGKFVVLDKSVLARLKKNNQIVFKYVNNPNGSIEDIAGICDHTGRIMGLMPHPERHIDIRQHPRWERSAGGRMGHGFLIIKNGVEYAKKYL